MGHTSSGGVMCMSNRPKQVNGVVYHESILRDVFVIGVYGGFLWCAVGLVAAFFHFMDVSPKFIFTSWSDAAWIHTWLGAVVTLIIYSIVSIVFAYLYYALFRKVNHISAGIVYGALLWLIFILILQPIFPDLPSFSKMTADTGITSICLFILYGVFVGYSISYEYGELQRALNRDKTEEETS